MDSKLTVKMMEEYLGSFVHDATLEGYDGEIMRGIIIRDRHGRDLGYAHNNGELEVVDREGSVSPFKPKKRKTA